MVRNLFAPTIAVVLVDGTRPLNSTRSAAAAGSAGRATWLVVIVVGCEWVRLGRGRRVGHSGYPSKNADEAICERERRKALTVDEKFYPRQNGGRVMAAPDLLSLFTNDEREQGLKVEVPESVVQCAAGIGRKQTI